MNAEYQTIITQILKIEAARAVAAVFERLLDNHIRIPQGSRETASASQNYLRDTLNGIADYDSTFPRILKRNGSDFLGGSFARHVKVKPLDDIDIYFPLDGHHLKYFAYGRQLPYTVVSDGVLTSNPLLGHRWTNGSQYISSAVLIQEFTAVLQRSYPQSEVYSNNEAVAIRLTHGQTDRNDGLGYDVVPCFLLKPDNLNEREFYLIPDGSDGWKRTNPIIDEEIAERLHKENSETFRKVVRLLKYWNVERFGGAFASYYIELAIARAYITQNNAGQYIRSISSGVALAFMALQNAALNGDGHQDAWIAYAPPVETGRATFNRSALVTATSQAQSALGYEQYGLAPAAIKLWRGLYGPTFPEN